MIFAEVAVEQALGAILAHSTGFGAGAIKKGRLLDQADINSLKSQRIDRIHVARLESDDIGEDAAAAGLANALAQPGLYASPAATGRANIYASEAGLLRVDGEILKKLNGFCESITIACLNDFKRVEPGQLIATVKIITYAVPKPLYKAALTQAELKAVFTLKPFSAQKIGLILTTLPHHKKQLAAKAEKVTRERLQALGNDLSQVLYCEHEAASVTAALQQLDHAGLELILIAGAIATVDRGDVIPAALVQAGGSVTHFGMPVDPGNLLGLGRLGQALVIIVPSCARSPKVNGFDLVLQRLLAKVEVTSQDIRAMGQGGLLAEITTRPQPRNLTQRPKVAGLILAAGCGTRLGQNKMMALVKGKPMVLRALHAAEQARLDEIIVVTGHEPEKIFNVVERAGVTVVHNPHYAQGMASSLVTGLAAVAADISAVIILLGDMPEVTAEVLHRLIAAFNPQTQKTICVPTFMGKRGNPVLWGRQHFAALMQLTGDRGGKALLDDYAAHLIEVPLATDGILIDIDTPEAWNRHK